MPPQHRQGLFSSIFSYLGISRSFPYDHHASVPDIFWLIGQCPVWRLAPLSHVLNKPLSGSSVKQALRSPATSSEEPCAAPDKLPRMARRVVGALARSRLAALMYLLPSNLQHVSQQSCDTESKCAGSAGSFPHHPPAPQIYAMHQSALNVQMSDSLNCLTTSHTATATCGVTSPPVASAGNNWPKK